MDRQTDRKIDAAAAGKTAPSCAPVLSGPLQPGRANSDRCTPTRDVLVLCVDAAGRPSPWGHTNSWIKRAFRIRPTLKAFSRNRRDRAMNRKAEARADCHTARLTAHTRLGAIPCPLGPACLAVANGAERRPLPSPPLNTGGSPQCRRMLLRKLRQPLVALDWESVFHT